MKFMNVALMVFVNERGDILLNKRRNSKNEEMWDLIGGGVEENETPLEAIVREIKEELSYDASVSQIKNLGTHHIETDKYQAEVTFFVSAVPELEAFTSSDEVFVEDLAFISPGEALTKNLLPMTRLLFDKELLVNT